MINYSTATHQEEAKEMGIFQLRREAFKKSTLGTKAAEKTALPRLLTFPCDLT